MSRTPIGALTEFELDQPRIELDGTEALCAVRLDFGLRVFVDRCPHARCELSEGVVDDGCIECPCHGALFSLDDGSALSGPTQEPLVFLATDVAGAEVVVDLQG